MNDLTAGDIQISSTQPDAGFMARETLVKRAAHKAAVIAKRTLILTVVLIVLVLSAIAAYGYYTRSSGYLTDSRNCSWMIGDYELKGSRTYSYPFLQVFGFRSIDTTKIEEKTYISPNGMGLTVIGLSGDDWWSLTIKEGERSNPPIKYADSYVFQTGKSLAVAKYKEFCK